MRVVRPSFLPVATVLLAVSLSAPIAAQPSPETDNAQSPYDVMHWLSRYGLHDLDDERFNVYGQLTYISSWKRGFSADYTNANGSVNSLLPRAERSFTGSATLYWGVRPWRSTEMYFVPEVISERPFSKLRGIGGAIQNFELQKTGGTAPQIYRSRWFLRQTLGLGGVSQQRPSSAMQLGSTEESRRFVVTLGNFSVLDVFDKNRFTCDPRQQFFNMAFMTHAAYDFASDARGYSWGGSAELYWDDWVVRVARMMPPKQPNQLAVGLRLDRFYGDQMEIERSYEFLNLPGALRFLGYRNRAFMGRFDDATAAIEADPEKNAANCGSRFNYGSENERAPDLCWVRKPNIKLGFGVSLEQNVSKDVGVFLRAMYSDGKSEVQAYTSSDRSIALGALADGSRWYRPKDRVGIGGGMAWISKAHAKYLRMGGIDGFIGDGGLNQAPEGVFEVFYSFNVLRQIWLSADYQLISNPAFNADRGPVNVIGGRTHAEF